MALSPDEQKRLIVSPATLTGRPARMADTRAMLCPWVPCGWPQPRITSSTSLGSSCGTLPSASLMQWAARSDGSVMLNEPRSDLASGVRELATTTASLMGLSSPGGDEWPDFPPLRRRPQVSPSGRPAGPVASLLELLEHLGVELRDVIRLAAGDDALVHHDGLVHPLGAGVPEVGLERWPRGDPPAANDAGLHQRPRPVADHRHRLALVHEGLHERHRVRVHPQGVGIHDPA